MKNILLTISYDGTDFCGWQRQDDSKKNQNMRTVQGEIEKALEKLLKTKITLYGSGRTDSGVHAYAQAANFYSQIDSIPQKNYVRALNSILPPDIRIMDAQEKDDNFSARKNATSRIYRYFINFSGEISANQNRYVWNVPCYNPDLKNLNEMAFLLKGEMNCASFSASGDKSVSTFRYIDGARFFFQEDMWKKNLLVFEIEANAFLWKMVRTITGTLINLDKSKKNKDDFKKIIQSCERKNAGLTAPPQGLFLYKIHFDGIRRHI